MHRNARIVWIARRRLNGAGTALATLAACGLLSGSAAAETVLTVDLGTSLGPATHVASGSLYGVTETLPADVTGLIAPLKPRMFTNPAANVQQPVGDAIVVARRVAATGATVTIRLADWLKGFYTFTNMNDWLDKVSQTVARRKAANLTNVYAYEIWNEPNGTYASSNPMPFNEFWRQTFVRLRELDPGIKITGPSLSYYNETFLRSFLSFCKTNACLPDIVGWHELGGGNFTATYQAYRALERSLGIGPLPISINEYSGAAHLSVEGQPGASAPLIAKFERFKIDSACISYWDVARPGRLGSLLATNTEPNGGWWFYKWYGDMSGNMVSTTPPSPSSATALDGFANLDSTTRMASVLFGGTNDGTIRVNVKGFGAAAFFGNRVRAVVERTPFVNRTTVVRATSMISTRDLDVANDQINVSVTGANATDGYRLSITPLSSGVGGAGGAGGATNLGGAGGAATVGGATAMGGRSSGGTSSGGKSNGGASNGGASSGATSIAGTSSGGSASGGGGGRVAGSGGALVGGASSPGIGSSGRGGFAGAASLGASAGSSIATSSMTGGSNAAPAPESDAEDSGCGCRVGSQSKGTGWGAAGVIIAFAARFRRTRSRGSAPRRGT